MIDLLTSRFLLLYMVIAAMIALILYLIAGYAYIIGREHGRRETSRHIRHLRRYE